MANKPMKIKRNASVAGRKYKRTIAAKKILALLFALAGLIAIGYFGAPAVVEFVNGLGENNDIVINQPSAEPTPTPGEIVEPTTNPGDVRTDVTEKTGVYALVDVYSLTSDGGIEAAVADCAAKGVTHAVVTLKNADGFLHYESGTTIGTQAKHNQTIDVKKVVDMFGAKDIEVVANIYAFKDKTTPNIDRSTAVKYVGTDMNWWDNSQEFGGKPWANPASGVMQQYIADLVQEIKTDFGINDFMFSAVQLPEGYSLDKRDFGVSESALQAQVQGFIDNMEAKVAAFGGDAFFAFDIAAANGGDVAKYIVAPQRLGAANLALVGTAADFETADLESLSAKLKEDFSVEKIVFWNTEAALDGKAPETDSYFIK